MTDYTTARAEFIATVTPELERAISNIRTNRVNRVSSYELARQADGSVEAFADGVRVTGTQFWTVDADDVATGFTGAADYLDVYADDMRGEYADAE